MRITIILIFLILSPIIVLANEKDSTASKWSIGCIGSIDFYNLTFSNEEGTGLLTDHYYIKREFYHSEEILLSRNIGKQLKISTGLISSEQGFNRITNLFLLPPYSYDSPPREIRYYLYNIGVPIILNYFSTAQKGFRSILSRVY